MSVVRSRSRLLTSTVAVATAGALAFAPLASLAQEGGRVTDPIVIRVGTTAEFTKVEFAGVIGARARVRHAGQHVVVRVGTTAAPDVSLLKVNPPPGVTGVETRAVQGGTEIILTLAEGAVAHNGAADGSVWLNLYPTAPADGAPAAPAAQVSAVTPVSAQVSPDKAVLSFRWSSPVGAAVFRRGGAVWIVFDASTRFDMATRGAQRTLDLGPAGEARWASGPDYSVVRIDAPETLTVSAVGEGATWTVTLGGPMSGSGGVDVTRDDSGQQTLIARMAGATRAIWLTDPMSGDRFAAVTALGPTKGYANRFQTVDLTVLPTAQGLAVESRADDLTIAAAGDLVTLSRPRGLILSPPSAALEVGDAESDAPKKAPHPALILEEWARTPAHGFGARYRELQDRAAEEQMRAGDDPRAPIEARMALARFLVGSGLGYEAVGVLNGMVAKTPSLMGEPELRGLRGVARAQIGRYDEAQIDFSAASITDDPATKVWLGYLAAQNGDWDEARRAFTAGAGVIDQFPTVWRARFGAAHAMAAVETGDLAAARSLLSYSFSQNAPAADQLEARLVQARMFELEGQGDRALAVYTAVGRAPLDGIATPARLAVVRMKLARQQMKPDEAAAQLESLKWRWRGDATELAVIRALGELYLSQGRYREALETLRGAGKRMGDLPGAAELQADLANAFRALFLEGAADGLQPVQALALFFDFRDLTPLGADGDEMVRRLARRLIDVDLLTQAAELLKYQVDSRLEGVAKAQVATDLATVYLMNRQPEQALQAIWGSRTTLLPTAMNGERRALEARALYDLGRLDHALEVLDRDQSPEARAVRAEIAWKQQKWADAAAIYEGLLGERWKTPGTPLTPEEETRLLRAGIGWSLAHDNAALARLSRAYGPMIETARRKDALRIALADQIDSPATIATVTAQADAFTGWVAAMKTQFRAETAKS